MIEDEYTWEKVVGKMRTGVFSVILQSMNLIETALRIAVVAHKDQVRKTDGSPYVVHPIMVGYMIEKYGFPQEVVAAAITHDVLEDTTMTVTALQDELGETVVTIVKAVSEDKELEWEERKKRYIETVVLGGEHVWAVSAADKIHNSLSLIDAHQILGSEVWTKFRRNKQDSLWFLRTLCNRLKEVWTHPLLVELESVVARLEKLE
jgi:(p)ppGpp synthase/HD superfamily hydrolase